jgi:L-seryl-tRNA(Ser) seleniumtransferase
MNPDNPTIKKLRLLPGVDRVLASLQSDPLFENIPRSVQTQSVRAVLDDIRQRILTTPGDLPDVQLAMQNIQERVRRHVAKTVSLNLKPLVNATGVVVHTNLGRSLLAPKAVQNIAALAGSYSNLEFDLSKGRRGSRYSAVEDILCEISGAEAAMVVNNNAAAVLLCLDTVAKGKRVIVSRGELVEIGGAFRIPDVMAKSGARLMEVGTTNRTHQRDYEDAIDSETGLLLKVHTSNYSIVGFTAEVALNDLVALGRKHAVPVMEDLGSGTLIDFSRFGLIKEPTVQESVAAGLDICTFSGDKLLGGPQAGIILGKHELIAAIRKNPLTRALRIDKLTLAALESTLHLYRDEAQAIRQIPTLRLLLSSPAATEERARRIKEALASLPSSGIDIKIVELTSRAGGGSLPLLKLPGKGLSIKMTQLSANGIERAMRRNDPPIIGRIEEDLFIIDPRTVKEDDIDTIVGAFQALLAKLRL